MDYSLLVGIHHKGSGDGDTTPRGSTVDSNEPEMSPSTVSSSSSSPNVGESSVETRTSSGKVSRSAHSRRIDIVETPNNVFYFGVIDILQPYNTDKKMERFAKVYLRCKDGDGISSVEPKYYARRFVNSIQNILS